MAVQEQWSGVHVLVWWGDHVLGAPRWVTERTQGPQGQPGGTALLPPTVSFLPSSETSQGRPLLDTVCPGAVLRGLCSLPKMNLIGRLGTQEGSGHSCAGLSLGAEGQAPSWADPAGGLGAAERGPRPEEWAFGRRGR